MEIAEIRDLDGPNLFLPKPALKLEIDAKSETPEAAEAFAMAVALGQDLPEPALVPVSIDRLGTLLVEVVNALHDRAGAPRPDVTTRKMEAPHHLVVAFGWQRRRFARRLARVSFDVLSGSIDDVDAAVSELSELLQAEPDVSDVPEMLSDAERTVPIIGITGTNGKTTTTRLVASILMNSGKRVGWTSSSGVLIQGEPVLEGDYTGPAGAARVFEEPDLDIAVLETARGGILLRGLGYESNDVSVVTNVSDDHLGLHGVYTVDELARVKRVVAAVTREDGWTVLNADDERVLGMREGLRAQVLLVTRQASNPTVVDHLERGGWALWVEDGQIRVGRDGKVDTLTDVTNIPITLGGRATHMVENALCAAGATLAIGLNIEQVRDGLARFRNQPGQNRGRLNVFDVNGVTVIVDFAHNPAGLKYLLGLGRSFVQGEGKLIAAIGSAGDRPDETFLELGRMAGSQADLIIAKDTIKYLRGRQTGDLVELMVAGVREAGNREAIVTPNEYQAFAEALDHAKPGDAIAIMCIEDIDKVIGELERTGTPIS